MADGFWKLTLAAVSPGNIATVPCSLTSLGDTEPRAFHDEAYITFRYADGHSEHYPWANLLLVEHVPPTRDPA